MSYLFTDKVGFVDNAVDAFNRLKVSNPFTLFDSQHRYVDNGKWDTFAITGGTANHVVSESVINMTVGLTAGSKVTRETKRVFPYQPGKSLLIMNTFAMATPKDGLRQRIGYFGITAGATASVPYNGVFLEQDGLTAYIVLQSASLNSTQKIPQSSWNGDTFNGSGASGRTLDVTKGNIFWTDIEWLGVGDVRTGFIADGRPIVAHTFHNDNINPTTYMTTACLPIRYELENTKGQTANSTTKQICSTVISEGGYQGFSKVFNITNSGASYATLATAGTQYPLIAIRLNANRLDSIIVPKMISAVLDETTNNKPDVVWCRVMMNPSLSGGSWVTHPSGTVDYNITATSVTGGTEIQGDYLSSSGMFLVSDVNNFNFQLGRTQKGVSDVLVLTMTPVNAGAKILTDLAWEEVI